MKYFMFMLIIVGLLIAIEMPAQAKIDKHHDKISHEFLQEAILIDSSGARTTMWTQIHESIAYSPIADGIQIVNRGFDPTGELYVHQIAGDLSFWIHDGVYMQELGAARYPTAVAGTNAYISFPFLDPNTGAFGHMGAQYEAGGWFSSSWANPVDVGPGDIGVTVCIGKQLPDGNILFIGWTVTDTIIYRTWNATLTNLIDSGIIATGMDYWGFDINGDIASVFYNDPSNDTLIYYKTTTDGITWSAEQIWGLAFTPPYPNTDIIWRQMALTDDGQPRLVFDAIDADDASYPWYGKIYVSHTSGLPLVELTAALGDTETIYPTIACGGGEAVAIFNVPRNNLADSLNWWDIHYCYSTDNGITWSEPINLTESSPERVGLQQIAKRVDTLRNQFFYIYNVDMIANHDPLWHVWFDPWEIDPMYIYFDYAPIVGIEENTQNRKPNERYRLAVYPNPFRNRLYIKCSIHRGIAGLSASGRLKIFNAAGLLVRDFSLQSSGTDDQVCIAVWDGKDNAGRPVPAGIYFVQLETQDYKVTRKVTFLK